MEAKGEGFSSSPMDYKEDKEAGGAEAKAGGGGGGGAARRYRRHEPRAGQHFEIDERYTNLKLIGGGAYGMVCSADDAVTGQRVAIKKIANAFANLIDAKRIIREIKLLRHFDHENIVGMSDLMLMPAHTDDFRDIYIVTTLMETDLDRVIRSGQALSEPHYQYLVYQILRGLKYMHSASVLHRDMKPANLLVNSNCDLRICDFGLARGVSDGDSALGSEMSDDSLTQYVVTRWYRAPELLADCGGYGKALDMWGVGCIFAEMLGRTPFLQGRDPRHQLELIIQKLGSPTEAEMELITTDMVRDAIRALPHCPKVPLGQYFSGVKPEGLELLARMLKWHPADRITVEEALAHPYLAELHVENDEPDAHAAFNFDFERDCDGDLSKAALQQLAREEMAALLGGAAEGGRPSKKMRK